MFGIGFWETVVILISLIVFLKPEDIPKFFKTFGRIVGQIRSLYEEFVDNFIKIDNNRIKRPLDAYIPKEYRKRGKRK